MIGNESKSTKITQLETEDTITTDPIEISNLLDTHSSRIGPSLASQIHPVNMLIILLRQNKFLA